MGGGKVEWRRVRTCFDVYLECGRKCKDIFSTGGLPCRAQEHLQKMLVEVLLKMSRPKCKVAMIFLSY